MSQAVDCHACLAFDTLAAIASMSKQTSCSTDQMLQFRELVADPAMSIVATKHRLRKRHALLIFVHEED